MVIHHKVQGYENFLKFIEDLKTNDPIYVLYTGTKLANGKSWCPDCVQAEPFIEQGFKDAPKNINFVEVQVGDRRFWKDLKCPFRTDFNIKIRVLPTLVKWGTQKRLEGDQCQQLELIEMLLENEDA